jgi:hypothetical protein
MAVPEWEAVNLVHHHHTTTNTTAATMPPTPSMSHYFYGGTLSSCFADDFSIPTVPVMNI